MAKKYNLDAIRQKIAALTVDSSKSNRPKLNWFKPQIGTYEIRFLPYEDSNGQPFQEVSYYDNKQLSEHRFVAPSQFGMEDPILELVEELRKDRSNDTWKIISTLRPRERYYAPIFIRGEDEKEAQIWEMNGKLLQSIYSTLAHPDNVDENLMDPVEGYDFTLKVTDSGKKWNGYVVRAYDLTLRRKSSKLADTKKVRDEIVGKVPNLEEYFKSMVQDSERIEQIVENFLAARSVEEGEDADAATAEPAVSSRGPATNNAKVQSIEDAFADLDEEKNPF